MHASITGKLAAPLVRAQSLEAIKWGALVLMLFEHGFFFVFDRMPGAVMLMGRSVFPLFAIALAVGMSGMHPQGRAVLLLRMLSWGIVAAAMGALIREPFPANVLFTLALGVLFHSAWLSGHWSRWVVVVCAVLVGFSVEYGPLGVGAVALICWWGRDQRSCSGIGSLVIALLMICVVNGNLFALVAPVIAWALDRGDIAVPRVPRFFYWAYAGQWPVFAALRAVL